MDLNMGFSIAQRLLEDGQGSFEDSFWNSGGRYVCLLTIWAVVGDGFGARSGQEVQTPFARYFR